MIKAQVNQAFIFIFMIIIIGSIALVSFQLFTKGQKAACEAEVANFRINLEKFALSFTDFRTVNIEGVNAPCNYEAVCFISADMPAGGGSDYFIIDEYLELAGEDRDNNVFLIKDDKAEPIGLIPEISTPDQNSVCINREGPDFKIKFSGQGQKVVVDQG